jgi:hypothetical protein
MNCRYALQSILRAGVDGRSAEAGRARGSECIALSLGSQAGEQNKKESSDNANWRYRWTWPIAPDRQTS